MCFPLVKGIRQKKYHKNILLLYIGSLYLQNKNMFSLKNGGGKKHNKNTFLVCNHQFSLCNWSEKKYKCTFVVYYFKTYQKLWMVKKD